MSTQDATVHTTQSVSLADEEARQGDSGSSVLGLWDVVNNLTRLRPSQRERYRVTIFGSARAQAGNVRLRRDQAGGGRAGRDGLRHHHRRRPGADAGRQRRRRHRAGARPVRRASASNLPFEQDVNAFVTQAFEHQTFFTRLHQFVLASDAFIVAPGGIGTVLEMMMIWQLLQVRHFRTRR